MTEVYSLNGKRIWVPGHRGMVGSAIVRRLERENPSAILMAGRGELDLTRQADVEQWLDLNRPEAVFVPAAKVGGILANDSQPAEFIYENLMIEANVIHGCYKVGVEKLMFLGSSCIYPKLASQPISEEALLTGPLEETNQWYAVAKIAGIKMCQAYRRQYGCDFIAGMPTNLYGPGDNFDLTSSHVVPALLRKAHEAKRTGARSMEIWGTGAPRREFLHVDDCAEAIVFLMKTYSGEQHVNIGSGEDVTIEELARTIMKVVDFDGDLTKDLSKPDGSPRKLMSGDKLQAMGWSPKVSLEEGLRSTYAYWLSHGGSNDRRSSI